MTIPYWQDVNRQKLDHVDVAVIGGGIMGAASAYWLSKRKGLKVAVFEAQKCGSGASGRGAGFVVRTLFAYYNQAIAVYGRETARWLLRFNEESMRHLQTFVEQQGNRCYYDRCGSHLLACSHDELLELEESAQLMVEDGFEVEFCPADPLDRGYHGGIFNRTDVGVDTKMLVQHLFDTSGAAIFEGEEVWRIERSAGGNITVYSAGYELTCERLLLVSNAYAPLLEPWFADKIQPVRGQILVTKPLKKRILESMCSAYYGWDYFRQLPDSRFLMGGRRFLFRGEETGYADMVTRPVQTALQDYLNMHFPEVAAMPVDYRWSGVMAFTRDELPIVGELMQSSIISEGTEQCVPIPGAFYALGCNGHGLGHSMGLCKLLVEVALDGASAGIFDISRLDSTTNSATWTHAQQP